MEMLVFSCERPEFGQKGLEILQGPWQPGGPCLPSGTCRGIGVGGVWLTWQRLTSLWGWGAGSRVCPAQGGEGSGFGWPQEGLQELRGGRLVRGLGCQQRSVPVGVSAGLGSVLLALAKGGVSWRRGAQRLWGSWLGNKPSGASDGASFQQHSVLREGGQGLGCEELPAGPFLQTLGGPELPRSPRPPWLGRAGEPCDGRPGATRVLGRPSRRVEGRTEQEPGHSEKVSFVLRPSRARRREIAKPGCGLHPGPAGAAQTLRLRGPPTRLPKSSQPPRHLCVVRKVRTGLPACPRVS